MLLYVSTISNHVNFVRKWVNPASSPSPRPSLRPFRSSGPFVGTIRASGGGPRQKNEMKNSLRAPDTRQYQEVCYLCNQVGEGNQQSSRRRHTWQH